MDSRCVVCGKLFKLGDPYIGTNYGDHCTDIENKCWLETCMNIVGGDPNDPCKFGEDD